MKVLVVLVLYLGYSAGIDAGPNCEAKVGKAGCGQHDKFLLCSIHVGEAVITFGVLNQEFAKIIDAVFYHVAQNPASTEEEEAAFVHTTGMENAPLPTTTLDQIWDLVNGTHALMGDVNMLRTGCQITVTKHTTIVKGKAKKTAEGEANDAEENTFVTVTLAGNDYSKFIDISYAMANMAIPAFENYLVQEISKQLGEAMTDDVYDVIEDGLAAANKMTVATSGTLTYAELCAAFGELERVDEVAIYGKRKAIFNYLVGMTDDNGRPVLQPDPTGKAVGVILGAPVKIEDSVAAGKLLIGDGKKVTYNLVTDIMIETDRDIKKPVITHSGYARGEAALVDDKGLTLLTVVSG